MIVDYNELYLKIDVLQKSTEEKEKIIEKLKAQINSKSTDNMGIVLGNLEKIKSLVGITLNVADRDIMEQVDFSFQNEELLDFLQNGKSIRDLSSMSSSGSLIATREDKQIKGSKNRFMPKVDYGEKPTIDTDYVLTKKDLINVPQDPRTSIRIFCNSILSNLFSPQIFARSSPLGQPFKGEKDISKIRPRLDESKMNAASNLCHDIYWEMHGGACRQHLISCARYKCTAARRLQLDTQESDQSEIRV